MQKESSARTDTPVPVLQAGAPRHLQTPWVR